MTRQAAVTMVIGGIMAAVACGLAACAASTPVAAGAPLDRRFTLAPGGVAPIEGTSLRVRFEGVTGDSRCPVDVQCVRAGEATVTIAVLADRGDDGRYELRTDDGRPVVHGGVTIGLEALAPRPVSTRPIEPGEYRATFRATR